ncbi:MAG: TolC family protein [Deltaproteobacteria bacterium]|nr:TolC family protein [Deltaproteobacteria bacterium]
MRLSVLVVIMSLATIFSYPATASDVPGQLADMAAEANPEVSMLQHQVDALKEQEKASVMWQDPVFAVVYSNMPLSNPSLGNHPMSGIELVLKQTFPFPGKNDRRQAVATAQVDVQRCELEELKSQLRGKIKQFYWNLVLVKKLREIREKHITEVDYLLEVVKAKYASGEANQQDILKLVVLKEKLTDDINDFTQKERELTATINSVLHRDVNVHIESDDEIPLVKSTATLSQLIERAENERDLLKAWKKRAELERLAADREGHEKYPDITLWTGYRIREEAGLDEGEDFLTFGVSLPIPVDYRGRYEAKKGVHLANARASQEKYKSLLDGVSANIETSLSKWERNYQKALTYSERLIPDAEATLEAALSAWQVGRTEFSSLYQAELQLLNFEETVAVARAQTILMSLEIELLAGEPPVTEDEDKS